MKKFLNNQAFYFTAFLLIFLLPEVNSQNKQPSIPRDTLLVAAREIMTANPYCALATIDSAGQPQVRTMNPFPLGDEMVIWFATSRKSKKVIEIRNNPNVSVYYSDHANSNGFVNITGTAVVIDDKELLIKMKRKYWEGMPNWQDVFVLIKITPKNLDVINYRHGLNNDPETFRAHTLKF